MEIVGIGANPMPDAEARELLEQGLRILARLAVRAYLRRKRHWLSQTSESDAPTTPLRTGIGLHCRKSGSMNQVNQGL